MSAPFYVAPEQMMKDRAEYARKGIARGRALVAIEHADGVVFVGENPSRSLYKTSEIYDRIGFAGVGKYNEFESMRVAGIRMADVKGYQYAREDVTAKGLANAYSQALGGIFMGDSKPYEVELLIAQVPDLRGSEGEGEGEGEGALELYHILFDGSIVDEHRHVAIGGDVEPLERVLAARWEESMSRDAAIRLGAAALTGAAGREVAADALEVSGLDATRTGRRFVRVRDEQLRTALAG